LLMTKIKISPSRREKTRREKKEQWVKVIAFWQKF
jgi:hypothetical protein